MSHEITPEQLQEARIFRPIDPLEYARHNIEQDNYYREMTAQDTTLQETQSGIIGSEFFFSPDQKSYFVQFDQGYLRSVDRDSYLDIRSVQLSGLNRDLDTVPFEVRQYFKSSESFNRAVELTHMPGAEEDSRKATAKFLIEHNEYANERRKALDARVQEARQLVLRRVPELVESGLLPKTALERLELAESVTISVTDKVKGHENGNLGGYYKADETAIALSMYWGEDFLDEVIVHALVHLISGHRIVKNKLGEEKVERVGVQQIDAESRKLVLGTQEANEAYTQLITNLVRNPHMDIETALKHGAIYKNYMAALWLAFGSSEDMVASGLEAFFTSDSDFNEGDFKKALESTEQLYKSVSAEAHKIKQTKQLKLIGAGLLFVGAATSLVVMRKLKR